MIKEEYSETKRRSQFSVAWQGTILQPLIISIVATSLVVGIITIIRLISPGGSWELLPVVAFLAAIEGTFTTRWLLKPGRRLNKSLYRLAEIVVIILIIRLLTWTLSDFSPELFRIRQYILNPMSFFDSVFIFFVFVALIAWERSVNFSGIFGRLAISKEEKAYFTSTPKNKFDAGIESVIIINREKLMGDFFRGWIFGGVILVVLTGLTTLSLNDLNSASFDLRTISRLGLRADMLVALLVYFIGGLWLASQGRMAVMRARWLLGGIEEDEGIAKTWHRNSLILLLIMATVAAFLPIGSTLAISRLLQILLAAFVFISGFIVAIASLIYFFIASLFLQDNPSTPEDSAPLDLSQLIPPLESIGEQSETPALVIGSIFWIIISAAVIFAFIFFLRGRGISLRLPVSNSFLKGIKNWITGIFHRLRAGAAAISTNVRDIVSANYARTDQNTPPWRFIRVNALSPREQIRYFYLSTIKRAGKQGVKRGKDETPLEFSNDLKNAWPELDEDLEDLTDAFVEARYGKKNIDQEDLGPIKSTWKRIKSSLRQKRNSN